MLLGPMSGLRRLETGHMGRGDSLGVVNSIHPAFSLSSAPGLGNIKMKRKPWSYSVVLFFV